MGSDKTFRNFTLNISRFAINTQEIVLVVFVCTRFLDLISRQAQSQYLQNSYTLRKEDNIKYFVKR